MTPSSVSIALLALVSLSYAIPLDRMLPPLQWGYNGHVLTGIVAQEFLTAEVNATVADIIAKDKGLLRNVVNWADQVSF